MPSTRRSGIIWQMHSVGASKLLSVAPHLAHFPFTFPSSFTSSLHNSQTCCENYWVGSGRGSYIDSCLYENPCQGNDALNQGTTHRMCVLRVSNNSDRMFLVTKCTRNFFSAKSKPKITEITFVECIFISY